MLRFAEVLLALGVGVLITSSSLVISIGEVIIFLLLFLGVDLRKELESMALVSILFSKESISGEGDALLMGVFLLPTMSTGRAVK